MVAAGLSQATAEENMADKDSHDLFHDTLKDIYFAEKKILSALPKMAKAAQAPELKQAFEKHETETEEQVARLEKVFEEIEETPRGKTCDAIMGILEEGQEVMKEYKGKAALDACLRRPRRLSITRCRATARSAPGPTSLASPALSASSKPRSRKRKMPTPR